jgi:predicted permease
MPMLRNLLRALFRHDAMNREMTEEITLHLEKATALHMSRGLSLADAEREARREFGNVSVIGESGRDARGAPWVESARGDFRHAVRGLIASPTFTLVAVVSLAIGVGANTAIFSLVNAVLLRSLPVAHPEELVALAMRDSASTADPISLGALYWTNPLWEAIRDRTAGEAGYAVSGATQFNLAEGGEVRNASAMWVNGDYFNTLGVRPVAGRLLMAADDHRGCPATVVASESFWDSELGRSASAIGRPLRLSGKPYTLVGVAPREFFGVDVGASTQLYVPLCAEPVERGQASSLDHPSNWWIRIVARPKPGIPVERFAARLRQVSRAVFEAGASPRFDAERRAEFTSRRIGVAPAGKGLSEVRDQYSRALLVLMGMVALILMISCANVANLMLARGAARGREMAIRMAIGASRWRLIRQGLAEGIVLAVAGVVAGSAFAVWASRGLVSLLSGARGEVALDLSPDFRVMAFTAAVGVVTVLLFGLAPALRASSVDPQAAMKSGGRGASDGPGRFRAGKLLVVAQSALALILAVGAGLLASTFRHLTTVDPGFEAEGVLIARISFARTSIPDGQRGAWLQRIRDQLAAVPGVHSISAAEITPVSGSAWNDQIAVEGTAPALTGFDRISWFNQVDSGYFATMRTRLIAGRDFGAQDTPATPKVAIVNEAMAKHFFGDASPIGRVYYTENMGMRGERTTIIGVVENTRYRSIREEPEPIVYTTYRQDRAAGAGSQLVLRASSIPQAIAGLKAITQGLDPRIELTLQPLETQISRSLQRERMLALLSGFFGTLALVLAMVGLYGVMAYTVARRRVEIGIRIALGAVRGRVIRLVVGDAVMLVGAGVAVGLAVTFVTARVLGSLLYGVEARDPWMMIGGAAVLGASAVLAATLPAGRAASLHPVEALRED